VPAGAAVFVVSLDLPFAQKRWAVANNAEGLSYLSDYRDHSFATAYGVFSKNRPNYARQFIVSKDRTIAYAEIVPEVATERTTSDAGGLKKLG